MQELWPELVLVLALVVINGVLAGSELALISLRESQLGRLARRGGAGRIVARLARDPNRYLATIQIGITLAGFLASAAAAVTLAQPLVPLFEFAGQAAETIAVIGVTLVLAFLTLVLGELAPKRLALQRAEGWSLAVGRPLHWMSILARPAVWLLSVSTDAVVKLAGGEPGTTRQEADLQEVKDLVLASPRLSVDHRDVLMGAVEVAERTLREILVPRPDVVSLSDERTVREAIGELLASGHSRAPVAPGGALDEAVGVAHLRDLVAADPDSTVGEHVVEVEAFPETVGVLTALRRMQEAHQQMAFVIDEFGGVDGIVTVEDLVEELVGEIYDESDRDILRVRRGPGGSLSVPGRFPIHDLVDLGVDLPAGDYTTVAGLILDELGSVPEAPGDRLEIGDWTVTVVSLQGRSVAEVLLEPRRRATADG